MLPSPTTDRSLKVPGPLRARRVSPPVRERRSMESVHRILIVDDNTVNRAVAQGVFRKLGWQVDTLDSRV